MLDVFSLLIAILYDGGVYCALDELKADRNPKQDVESFFRRRLVQRHFCCQVTMEMTKVFRSIISSIMIVNMQRFRLWDEFLGHLIIIVSVVCSFKAIQGAPPLSGWIYWIYSRVKKSSAGMAYGILLLRNSHGPLPCFVHDSQHAYSCMSRLVLLPCRQEQTSSDFVCFVAGDYRTGMVGIFF